MEVGPFVRAHPLKFVCVRSPRKPFWIEAWSPGRPWPLFVLDRVLNAGEGFVFLAEPQIHLGTATALAVQPGGACLLYSYSKNEGWLLQGGATAWHGNGWGRTGRDRLP